MQNEMGYRWGQLERSVARDFQNRTLNMHGWSCIESWLQNDLVTTDIPFLLKLPSLGSFQLQECNWQCSPLIFIANHCLAPHAMFWLDSRLSHYSASPLEACSVYWCRLGRGLRYHLGPLLWFWYTVRLSKVNIKCQHWLNYRKTQQLSKMIQIRVNYKISQTVNLTKNKSANISISIFYAKLQNIHN